VFHSHRFDFVKVTAFVLIAAFVSIAQAELSDGLIAYWPFDVDGSDASGNGHDASLMGDAVIDVGLVNNGLDLPTNMPGGGGALNGWAEAANDSVFDLDGDFTLQAWVYYDSEQGGVNESVLIEHFSDAGGPGWTLTSFPQNGKDALFYGQGAVGIKSNNPAPDPNVAMDMWTHYVVTRSGSDYQIFADGQLAGNGTGGTSAVQSDQPLLFGMRNNGDGRKFPLNGTLDEVAIWGRTLDVIEIESLYNLGQGMSLSGTVTQPTEVAWSKDASGDFNLRNNWSPGRVPDIALGDPNNQITNITFGDVITTPQTVYTNSDVSVTQVTFLNANKYAIAGTGSVNFVTNSVAPKIDVFVGDHEFQTDVSVGSDMSVTVGAGTSLTFDNSLNLNGNTLTKSGPGTLNINNNVVSGAGGTIDCQGGNCAGSGTIGGNLSNNSLVSPGNSPGILSVDGNFTQSAGGTLEIELVSNGGVAGTDHDRLAVTLAASLDGTLDLQLDGGYSPTIGDSFAGIVTAGTVSGSFATTNNVVIDGRQGVAVTYTETAVNAQIGLRGNTDIASGDIDVDTSDLTTSIINFTSAGGTGKTWADGDMDGDGDVDTSDLTTSIINFTSALSSGSAAVPEPTSFVLLSLGMVLLLGRSRARR